MEFCERHSLTCEKEKKGVLIRVISQRAAEHGGSIIMVISLLADITFRTRSSVLIWLYLSNCSWLIGGNAILLAERLAAAALAEEPERAPPLFLNDIGEVGEESGGGGSAVKELVIVTICCRGLLLLGEKGMRGGGGRFEPDADCGVDGGDDSDLLSSSL